MDKSSYIFTSKRLGFRTWNANDLDEMAAISGDAQVMEFFPKPQDREFVKGFIERMQAEYAERGYCYYAVDILESGEFIGFLGLHMQEFESDFTPCVDIGWRLKASVWNRDYATEGALRCLEYAFEVLNLEEVYSMTPKLNIKSARIMQKSGMHYVKEFDLVLLKHDERLRTCVLYRVSKRDFLETHF
jgi:RimJ/RimL family protein N-acetyltransferase